MYQIEIIGYMEKVGEAEPKINRSLLIQENGNEEVNKSIYRSSLRPGFVPGCGLGTYRG
jgi:hypothetical protein